VHPSFLTELIDPRTKEPLALKAVQWDGEFVLEGSLVSRAHSYPIVRGVPRFAGYEEDTDNYTASFGVQWSRWSRVQFESENVGRPMEGHTLRMWERITGVADTDLHGAVFADFGCGPGRFVEIVRRKHGRVIGLDLSDCVEVAHQNFRGDTNVLICQADVLNPPFREESLDGAFSIGVLHHTPDAQHGFEKLVQCVRTGGWVAISVYSKGGYYDFPSVRLWRRVFRALWPVFGHYPALAYANVTARLLRPLASIPLLGVTLRGLFPFVRLPDIRWSVLDTYDSMTPAYQSAHEADEVRGWFQRCGLADIVASDWGVTAYQAVRK
jgi:SAM-dependent methyltransferase